MCGIVGFINTDRNTGREQLALTAERMAFSLRHRGPEDGGTWVDPQDGVALGHRRLSIIDLSPAGHQPMDSPCGRYVITFNGEIYNFRALSKELAAIGQKFRGHSDTEVMLAAISHWGVAAALQRFNGMFAFALWDRQQRTLYLSRDRAGEKPLYYGWAGHTFLFASELKALHQHPAFQPDIDRRALVVYLRHDYIPTPHSIYKDIQKLPAGTLLQFHPRQNKISVTPYWSAKRTAEAGEANPNHGSETETIDQLDALLNDAVKIRMEADVPLGAFLSGGIDSSLIVALMQANSTEPVKTFTIGFPVREFNEAEFAKAVAQHLHTDHTELYVTPQETMAVIPKLPVLYDEPFADSSQIPTFLVSQLARRKVTVSLSGDGGDELFGGYNTYLWGRSVHRGTAWLPRPLRTVLANSLRHLVSVNWNSLLDGHPSLLPDRLKEKDFSKVLEKLVKILTINERESLYWALSSYWIEPASIVLGAQEPPTVLTDKTQWASLKDFLHVMMYLDTAMYLPDDILVKVDRASMAVSLEARVPLLDHRVIEFAWRLPLGMKIKGSQGKQPLRQLLHRYVPKALVERPKKGFGVPIHQWLRGPLRPWAEELLSESRLRRQGFFCVEPIRKKWAEHISGRHNWQAQLWGVLMFQAWMENQRDFTPALREERIFAGELIPERAVNL
jgi:asparagine synthase (glutamine-hydrolysing)